MRLNTGAEEEEERIVLDLTSKTSTSVKCRKAQEEEAEKKTDKKKTDKKKTDKKKTDKKKTPTRRKCTKLTIRDGSRFPAIAR